MSEILELTFVYPIYSSRWVVVLHQFMVKMSNFVLYFVWITIILTHGPFQNNNNFGGIVPCIYLIPEWLLRDVYLSLSDSRARKILKHAWKLGIVRESRRVREYSVGSVFPLPHPCERMVQLGSHPPGADVKVPHSLSPRHSLNWRQNAPHVPWVRYARVQKVPLSPIRHGLHVVISHLS